MGVACTNVIIFFAVLNVAKSAKAWTQNRNQWDRLSDHTTVTENNVFPYVAAVLKKQSYLTAGALIDDKWVLTAADSLFLIRESARIIRIRLGSVNYKKGGIMLPVRTIEVHPSFDDTRPLFDLALIRLASRVRLSADVYPIRLQARLQVVTATHFTVTSWTPKMQAKERSHHPITVDLINQKRMLSVSQLHPIDPEVCAEELTVMDINDTRSFMCLDSDLRWDPCWRDTGAPVVFNGILWGIISSWRSEDCFNKPSSNFVTLVASPQVKPWIHSITYGQTNDSSNYSDLDAFYDDLSSGEDEMNNILV